MSDNEYEAFEITDYDLEHEFNPNRPRRNTKHQQIYGLFYLVIKSCYPVTFQVIYCDCSLLILLKKCKNSYVRSNNLFSY